MTSEDRFFDLVQKAAKEQGARFFISSGEGRELETGQLEGEDLSGWLVPLNKANDFFNDLRNDEAEAAAKWGEFFTFAEWAQHGDSVSIAFRAHSG